MLKSVSPLILLTTLVAVSFQQNPLLPATDPAIFPTDENFQNSNAQTSGQTIGAASSSGQSSALGPGSIASISNQATASNNKLNTQDNSISTGAAAGYGAKAGGTSNVAGSIGGNSQQQGYYAYIYPAGAFPQYNGGYMLPGMLGTAQNTNFQNTQASGNAGSMGAAIVQGPGLVSNTDQSNLVATNNNVQSSSVNADTAMGYGSKTVGSANSGGTLGGTVQLGTNFAYSPPFMFPPRGSITSQTMQTQNTGNGGATGTASAQGPNSASSGFNSANTQLTNGMTASNALNSELAMGGNAAVSGAAQAGGTLSSNSANGHTTTFG